MGVAWRNIFQCELTLPPVQFIRVSKELFVLVLQCVCCSHLLQLSRTQLILHSGDSFRARFGPHRGATIRFLVRYCSTRST